MIKYGVIGLGWFGEKHCEALDTLPGVELHSLCTRTESRLNEVGKRFYACKKFTDYNEMLRDPELDAVSVVTMWYQHTDPAIAARARLHNLLVRWAQECPRPVVLFLDEIDSLKGDALTSVLRQLRAGYDSLVGKLPK